MARQLKISKIVPGFTRVKLLPDGKKGTILDDLSKQITVDFDDGTFNFYFKADYGVEWTIIEENTHEETDKEAKRIREVLARRKETKPSTSGCT